MGRRTGRGDGAGAGDEGAGGEGGALCGRETSFSRWLEADAADLQYQSTPEALEVDLEYAEQVHEKNLLEHGQVMKEFKEAEDNQGRIAARHRKREQYARNKSVYGIARMPAVAKRKAAATPATAAVPCKHGRAEALPSVSNADAAGVPVAQELSWEGM